MALTPQQVRAVNLIQMLQEEAEEAGLEPPPVPDAARDW